MPLGNDETYLYDEFADIDLAFGSLTAAEQRAWMISRNGFARVSGATHAEGAPLVAGATAHEVDYSATTPLAAPGADRLLFWDHSALALAYLTAGTGLAISGTTMTLDSTSSPQITGIELGHATDTTVTRAAAGVIAVEGVPLYPNLPQNSQSAAYTLVLADASKHILHPSADTTARIWTIPANASVAFPIGTVVTFVNQSGAGVITIAITTDTMRLAGAGTTGSRTLAANGLATALKITSTEWIISGTGLT
jgi:hypothetical protein